MTKFHLNQMTNYSLPGRMLPSLFEVPLGWRWRHLHHLRRGGGTSITSGKDCTSTTSSSSQQRQEPSVTIHNHYKIGNTTQCNLLIFPSSLSSLVTNLLILIGLLALQETNIDQYYTGVIPNFTWQIWQYETRN